MYDVLYKHGRINDTTFIERFISTLKSEAAGIDVRDYDIAYKVADSIIEVLKNQNVKNLKEIDETELTPQPKIPVGTPPPSPFEMIVEKPIREAKVEATLVEDDNSISELSKPTKNVDKNVNKVNKKIQPKPTARRRKRPKSKPNSRQDRFFKGGSRGKK